MNRGQGLAAAKVKRNVEIFDQPVTPAASSLWKGLSRPLSICCPIKLGKNNYPSKTVELSVTDCSPQTVRDKSDQPVPLAPLLGENTAPADLPKFPDLHLCQTMGDQSTVVCSRIYHQNLAGCCPLPCRQNFCIFLASNDTSSAGRFSDKRFECKQGDSYSFKTAPAIQSFGTSSIIRSIGRQ